MHCVIFPVWYGGMIRTIDATHPPIVEDLDSLGMAAWDIINPLSYPDTTIGRYIPI